MNLIQHYPSHLDLDQVAADYPDRAILEVDGQVQRWLQVRSSQLLSRARHLSYCGDGTKAMGLVVGVAGALCWATPFGVFSATLGLLGWASAVFTDHSKTREFYPLPLIRENIFDVIQKAGDPDLRAQYEEMLVQSGISPLQQKTLDMLSYLNLEEYAEARMLLLNRDEVARLLQSVNLNIRFLLYLRIVEHYINNDRLEMSQQEVEKAIEGASHDYSVNYGVVRRLNELTHNQSYGRLPEAGLTPIAEASIPTTPRRRMELDLPAPVRDDRPVHQSNDRPEVVVPEPSTDRRAMNPPGFERPQAIVETGLFRIVADPFQSRAFFGAQRTGKSFFVAAATQQLAEKGVKIFHLNLASVQDDGEDDRYWSHATSVRGDLGFMDSRDAAELIAKSIALVKQFIDAPSGALLICDEWTVVGRKNHSYATELEPLTKMLNGITASLVSSGKKRQKAIWTIAPDMVAGGLAEGARLTVKDLALVLVSIAPWTTVEWSRRDGQGLKSEISFSHELFGQLERNYSGLTRPRNNGSLSSSDRIVFMDGHWYSLGVSKDSVKETIAQGDNAYIPIAGEPDPLAQEFNQVINGGNNGTLP